jgi:hypothetical protein
MTFRDAIAAAMLVLTLASGTAAFAGSPRSLSPSPVDAPPMMFYVAKGAPDACGRGCDTWIAVEGKIDGEAASRFRKFLLQTDRDWPATLPLYFSSPGGSLEQGLAMGRMLRQRPRVARVARTTVKECGDAQSQSNDACLKIKQSGRALDADLSTRGSLCSSACAYLILGATTRQIEPASVIGVHAPKVILLGAPQLSEGARAEVEKRSTLRADRLVAAYLATMGIDRGLLDLARTASYESMHFLTRSELYRFGIDTRSFAETGWTSQGGPPGFIRKIAVARKDDDASFQTIEWQLYCENKSRALSRVLWTSDAAAADGSSLSLMAGSEQPVKLVNFSAPGGSREIWKALIAYDALKKLFAVPSLELRKSTTLPDGKTNQTVIAIDTIGLEAAWHVLSFSGCPAAPVGDGMLTPANERR